MANVNFVMLLKWTTYSQYRVVTRLNVLLLVAGLVWYVLKETHFYCFHWTDSINGRLDIRKANKLWKEYNMEVVPIIDTNYILPDNFEEFKKSADGYYDPICCEGQNKCIREGYVYYKTTDPTFSFKNVSREYLGKK